MIPIRATATITSKGQITLPKSIRTALGLTSGNKLSFEIQGEQIIVRSLRTNEHEDPAITKFLGLMEKDLRQGKHLRDLPKHLQDSMLTMLNQPVDLNNDIDGEVDL
ncbi:type II toxin-antitoxin system PrlF family antitoxin [Desulfoplanes formicivorans]|uniref:AbrB family transcriptional regulator n=1 Tax=Desulfoplanes formicivorans TaxID=1592317 RepID=A0A194AIC2_9BACT|nr:type II toxin-antitoxin system PrlF family antitoxin [Desulfoplanes formicivorans]GAU08821.1 AbrB family transcriptional regulator [Desulfoplanes formicivorans]